MSNVVHEYFKKEWEGGLIMVQLNPVTFTGLELIIHQNKVKKTKRTFDEEIYKDFEADGFVRANPLEFNLYLKGMIKK
ncbi:MAG: hypothetical protein ACNS62_17205 [Candidatus Cyclobacteriaceae bacterium M3_2C_046]